MKKKDNNRTLKLIALLIAVVLWFYVGVEQDPLSHRTYDVPLETISVPAISVLMWI